VANYQIIATSVDGGGTHTFPVGTIFPPTMDPEYDDTGKVKRIREVYDLEGFFQEPKPNAEQKNFQKYFALHDFVGKAGRCTIQILFGGSTFRTITAHARGPILRNCRALHRGGSFASHVHFGVQIENVKETKTLDTEGAGGLKREKRFQEYDGRRISTTFTVTAEGEKAKEAVLKFKPASTAGPLLDEQVQQVDELRWTATWTIETPHKVGSYLKWEREVQVVEGGFPLEEIPILGVPDDAGGFAGAAISGPIIRRGLSRAFQITDTNRFTTLGKWRPNLPTVPHLFSNFRDPLRSGRKSPDVLTDPVRDVWTRTLKDFYLIAPEDFLLQPPSDPLPASIVLPADPPNWTKLH